MHVCACACSVLVHVMGVSVCAVQGGRWVLLVWWFWVQCHAMLCHPTIVTRQARTSDKGVQHSRDCKSDKSVIVSAFCNSIP
mmetsp:Transcript_64332/g.106929  ORF Transcript_64332/g.106929 Transcript_64332/m.106929 type:complete len:82 (-) Transcript_64332:50-295(-)